MADKNIKLTYFDLRARGETSRLILAAAGKEYEDCRIPFSEWPQLKSKLALGQLPILEVDGKEYPQSVAQWSFLAREFGLYGSSSVDQLRIDVVVHSIEDAYHSAKAELSTFVQDFGTRGPAADLSVMAKKKEELSPKFLPFLEKLLADNGTGYFVGDQLTLADIVMFNCRTSYMGLTFQFDDVKYPLLKQNMEKVLQNERIKEYVDKRKDCMV